MNPLEQYATDFMAFATALTIRTSLGVRRCADAFATFQLQRYQALAPSLQAVARGELPPIGRFWWEGTKGSSKDTDIARALLWLLVFCPRQLRIQIAAVDRDQADELRRAFIGILNDNAEWRDFLNVQSGRIVNGATGSEVEIISADVAGSHGARPDVLVLNELSHVPDGRREFAENLMDNSTKVPHGIVIIATNAGILDSWQWTWRENARQSERWSFHQYAAPAPWLTEADIEEARQRNSESRFSRLWMGEWVSLTERPLLSRDAILKATSLDCLWPGGSPPLSEHAPELYIGVDVGRTNDRTVIWTLQRKGDRAITRDVCVLRGVPFAQQKQEIHRRLTRNVVKCFIDKGAIGMQLAEELETEFPVRCEGIQLTSGRQGQISMEVRSYFDRGLIAIPDDQHIRADLQLVDAGETVNGIPTIKTNRGPTGHADRYWALALAVHAMPTHRPTSHALAFPIGIRAHSQPSTSAMISESFTPGVAIPRGFPLLG